MHVILWEFLAHPDTIREFVSAYRSQGDWAKLFKLAAGYQGTELLSCTNDAHFF
jgi:hypothetical protein